MSQKRGNTKKKILKHIEVKLLKTNNKQKILRASRGKKDIFFLRKEQDQESQLTQFIQ